jgi:hypothetical protein
MEFKETACVRVAIEEGGSALSSIAHIMPPMKHVDRVE